MENSTLEKEFEYPQIDVEQTGQRLRWLSKSKGISVRKIQEALSLSSNQAIYDWFNGKTLPTLNNFYALSTLMGVAMEQMLVAKGEMVYERVLLQQDNNRRLIRIGEYQKRLLKVCA